MGYRGWRSWMGGIVILASCEHFFIKVHENLVQHPGIIISIIVCKKLAYEMTHIQGHKRQPVTQHLYKTVSNVTALRVEYYNSF